jgi:acyl-CoA ligase (AMP-forming) (exosortase A-associated)
MNTILLHELILASAYRSPGDVALKSAEAPVDYEALSTSVERFAAAIVELGVVPNERIATFLEKRSEMVTACFGAVAAGAVFVPVNPLLKAEQVAHILRDCNARVLVTSNERLALIRDALRSCRDLRHVIVAGRGVESVRDSLAVVNWDAVVTTPKRSLPRRIDTDMAAILYTSGSTGRPKGVVLSHRNMVAGAKSVAQYLENHRGDTLLAALPLSFDAGFSQLTTAFHVGASVVLLNYLLPIDVLKALARDRVSGLTAVPPLWIQLSQQSWPPGIAEHLRYIANTGGRMPFETLSILRRRLPKTKPFLMYGLTEAFRSTYLPPEQVDRRPDSIGKAIPNAEILVLRPDGTPCAPNEPGELVHRGALVGMGYWNDAEKTAERYRPLPGLPSGLTLPEIAVFSGDTVRTDEEGFLYFIGRRDEMIKTSGYRVSPTEVEEVVYLLGAIAECAAFGVPHSALGEAIVVVAMPKAGETLDSEAIVGQCRALLPTYMVPSIVRFRSEPLPRNPNGKIDRKTLAAEFASAEEQRTT